MSDDNHFDDLNWHGDRAAEPRPASLPRTAAQVRAAMARTSKAKLDELADVAEKAHRRHTKWSRRYLDSAESSSALATQPEDDDTDVAREAENVVVLHERRREPERPRSRLATRGSIGVAVTSAESDTLHPDTPQNEADKAQHREPLQEKPGGRTATGGTPSYPVVGYVRRRSGIPVQSAVLTLIDARGFEVARAAGAADGSYSVPSQGPGEYVLIMSAHGHQPQASSVVISNGPATVDVTLAGSGELTGTVRAATTGDPLANVTVTLTDGRGQVNGAFITTADGTYAFVGVGAYTLVASGAGYRPVALTVTVPDSGVLRHDVELRVPVDAGAGEATHATTSRPPSETQAFSFFHAATPAAAEDTSISAANVRLPRVDDLNIRRRSWLVECSGLNNSARGITVSIEDGRALLAMSFSEPARLTLGQLDELRSAVDKALAELDDIFGMGSPSHAVTAVAGIRRVDVVGTHRQVWQVSCGDIFSREREGALTVVLTLEDDQIVVAMLDGSIAPFTATQLGHFRVAINEAADALAEPSPPRLPTPSDDFGSWTPASAPSRPADASTGWNFGADENWRTVQAVSQSTPATFASTGLPRRRRGEQLLPGSAAPPTGAMAPRPQRDAHDVHGRLRSFQQGIERGSRRAARRAESNPEALEGE